MTKYRIVKRYGFFYLHSLEKKSIFGFWRELVCGSENECLKYLTDLKSKGCASRGVIVHEEEF